MATGSSVRRFLPRLLLVVAGSGLGLAGAEGALRLLDLPHFYRPHTTPPQFGFISRHVDGNIFYLNRPSARIRFVYDGNPRGYFGPDNEIEHRTNSLGFRGDEFQIEKPPNTFRLVFLGDSFTFGEGVKEGDTYPEVTESLLQSRASEDFRYESINLAVGGHNTLLSSQVFSLVGRELSPDLVVLGYVLNDAELPLFEFDQESGKVVRRPRAAAAEESRALGTPPGWTWFRFRVPQLIWQFWMRRRQTRETVTYYRSLFEESNPGWQQSRDALGELGRVLSARNIPFCVLLFPILLELNENYPFLHIHERIRQEVEANGALFVDLLPHLMGMDERDLWVHPSDHHPNEKVHALAARALVDALLAARVVPLRPVVSR